MFLLVNVFNAIPGSAAGTVVSRHKSLEAAQAARARLERAIRRRSVGSYLPTEIIQVTRAPRGRWVTLDYLADARVAAAGE